MGVRVVTVGLCLALFAVSALPVHAARPAWPTITEPAASGQVVHPADVHMETAPFFDGDGDAHHCTTWLILLAGNGRRVWEDRCDTVNKAHVHLGDGDFVGPYARRSELKHGKKYILRVRHAQLTRTGRRLWSRWAQRRFTTSPTPPPGTTTAWTVRQDGFAVDVFATGLQLPVNLALVSTPAVAPSDPFLYVTELHGAIKVVARDGSVSDYFNGALNYAPPLTFPGSGEQGLVGIAVEPVSGDVFASMLYEASDGLTYGRVVRFHSGHGGAVAVGSSLVIDMRGDPMGASHQVSNVSFGPDGMLYVHVGDGFSPAKAQDLDSFLGKILRMTPAGAAPADNPFYDSSDGIGARDYVFAYGFRNPFGGAWRSADGQHYEVENGPKTDRFAKVIAGRNYLWDGTDASMANHALFTWQRSVAPVSLAFVEQGAFGGSGFPADKAGHAFVTESGPTYASGPQVDGKRVTEFVLDAEGDLVSGPTTLVEYTGTGRATAAGLAAGPDGLYFTDLYRDLGASGPTDRGAQILRIRWVGD